MNNEPQTIHGLPSCLYRGSRLRDDLRGRPREWHCLLGDCVSVGWLGFYPAACETCERTEGRLTGEKHKERE